MKYIIINSDILLNGKLIPENSEVELSAEETKGIEDYIIPSAIPSGVEGSSSTNNEQKIKTKRGKK